MRKGFFNVKWWTGTETGKGPGLGLKPLIHGQHMIHGN